MLPQLLVSSYLTVSPLPNKLGGLLSVALSCGSPQVDVIHHSALWSPDFPRVSGMNPESRDHPTDSSINKDRSILSEGTIYKIALDIVLILLHCEADKDRKGKLITFS